MKKKKRVSFSDEYPSEERVPLLSAADDGKRGRKDSNAASSAAASADAGAGEEDAALVHLQQLPRILVQSCKVFTVAACLSVLLASVSWVLC